MNHGDRDGEECGSTHRECSKIQTLDWVSQHTTPDTRKHDVPGRTERSEQHKQHKVEEEKRQREHLHDQQVAAVRKAMKEDGDRSSPCNIREELVNLYAGQVDYQWASRTSSWAIAVIHSTLCGHR